MVDIQDAKCNGWAAYDPKFIEGEGPHNVHIVEARITKEDDGRILAAPNDELKTVCGAQHLIKDKRTYTIVATDEKVMRSELSRLQNAGVEVCGQCVAHFYADPEGESV